MLKVKRSFLFGAAVGAAAAYLFDPDRGRGRRVKAVDMVGARLRRGARRAEHPGLAEPDVDDRTLKDRIESTVSGPGVPKGDVLIDVVDGVVTLRGQAKSPDRIKGIERRVSAVPGVAGVENLLHVPGQTARNKAPAVRASRRAEHIEERIQRKTG